MALGEGDLLFVSDIDAGPNAILEHLHPGVPNLGDISRIDWADKPHPDVLAGGFPCFPAGTPILTRRGLVPIEEVHVGDECLTHENRWQPVTATGSREADIWGDSWMESTAEHKYWTREKLPTRYRTKEGRSGGYPQPFELGEPEYHPITQSQGRFLAIPNRVPQHSVPTVEGYEQDEHFWRLVGIWIADGWLRIVEPDRAKRRDQSPYSKKPRVCGKTGCNQAAQKGSRDNYLTYCSPTCAEQAKHEAHAHTGYRVVISSGTHSKNERLESVLNDCNIRVVYTEERTARKYRICNKRLALWLRMHFGEKAHGKTLPAWVFGMPEHHRRALFEGYMQTDGCQSVDTRTGSWAWRAVTVSPYLAVGMRLLAESIGYSAGLSGVNVSPTTVIEGRTVNQRKQYALNVHINDGRYSRIIGSQRWVRKRTKHEFKRRGTVYNITVDVDHSYIAWGYVVANCQSVSLAGTRAGLKEGTRTGLWFEMRRCIEETQPRLVIAENVRGLLTAEGEEADERTKAADERLHRIREQSEENLALLQRAHTKGDVDVIRERNFEAVRLARLEREAMEESRAAHARLVRAIGAVLRDLAELGYDALWRGIPVPSGCHRRFRIFILAWRRAADADRTS